MLKAQLVNADLYSYTQEAYDDVSRLSGITNTSDSAECGLTGASVKYCLRAHTTCADG